MSEISDMYRDMREHTQSVRQKRAHKTARLLKKAQSLARQNGIELLAHTRYHFQLRHGDSLWNIYPTSRRIYVDAAHKDNTPFLKLTRHWSIVDAVEAAIEAVKGK